jgi:hypothetical protein
VYAAKAASPGNATVPPKLWSTIIHEYPAATGNVQVTVGTGGVSAALSYIVGVGKAAGGEATNI